jgi:Ca-activated chloride channel homolog
MKRLTKKYIGLIALSSFLTVGAAFAVLSAEASNIENAGSISPTPTPTVAATPFDDSDEVIKVETELVNLNVRVVDRNNRSINNVPQQDFKIFEDGVQQTIEFFSRAEVPTNYALVIDNSASLRSQLEKVIEAGKVLVNANRPADETMIIRFVGRDKIEIQQDFTENKIDLIDSLENLYVEGGQTAVIDAVYLAVENVDEYEKSKKAEDRKRRAIILITDGEDRNSFYNEKQLLELLKESEVQIYVVGFIDELSREGGFIGRSPQAKAKALLEKIANETGGKVYFPSRPQELPEIARDISSELRSQYSIGYIPTNDRTDGTFRSIKVQVADGPNKTKRIAVTRAGRVAEAATPTRRR